MLPFLLERGWGVAPLLHCDGGENPNFSNIRVEQMAHHAVTFSRKSGKYDS
jgi:hypothetical protein